MTRPARPGAGASHRVRIIGGAWRRTPLSVPDVDGLRPSPDRVRETLFNWLGQDLTGLRCLDLFAGTGALGLEAASRGAARVVLVERDRRALAAIAQTLARLDAPQVRVEASDALAALERAHAAGDRFDVVFLDPPFRQGWIERVLPRLGELLAHPAWLYLESESALAPDVPARLIGPGCEMVRHGRAGQVFYHLVRCS
ncbi:MAG: 16S rRNA (guanine(966)-N(2))-methyltransferase RsmD [Burkholderiaceae bacterium]